eukprot:5604524-Prymnesium_polylepis.3
MRHGEQPLELRPRFTQEKPWPCTPAPQIDDRHSELLLEQRRRVDLAVGPDRRCRAKHHHVATRPQGRASSKRGCIRRAWKQQHRSIREAHIADSARSPAAVVDVEAVQRLENAGTARI